MCNTKAATGGNSQQLFADIRDQLPRFAKLLGKMDPMDLEIFDYNYWAREYMYTEWRDVVVATDGILEDMPHILRRRSQQEGGAFGYGATVFESRLDSKIKYIVYNVRGAHEYDEKYLIVAKENSFKLKRNYIRLNKMANEKTKPPILEDGVLDEVVQNTVNFLLRAKEIEKFGVKIKRGLILDGDPGNGKTMLCRYIQKLCSQNNIRWGVVTSSDIDGAYEDKALGELFTRYTVTFFDDIDVGYMDRKRGNGKMACSLLTAMDGMSDEGHLVRIFTTNEPVGELDPAFTRPGRIDKSITLEKPDARLRRRLVDTVWPQQIKDGIDLDTLIKKSEGYSFAELESIRTMLVTQRIFGNKSWDLAAAFDEFEGRRTERRRKGKSCGFGGS